MIDDLKTITCPKCGEKAKEVIHAEKNIRRGWYCTKCQHFEKALFRERKVV